MLLHCTFGILFLILSCSHSLLSHLPHHIPTWTSSPIEDNLIKIVYEHSLTSAALRAEIRVRNENSSAVLSFRRNNINMDRLAGEIERKCLELSLNMV